MRTLRHYTNLPARRLYAALLISAMALMATLPMMARAQADPPGDFRLDVLPSTISNNEHFIYIAHEGGTWVYKLGEYSAPDMTTGATPFNGTITGTMPTAERSFQILPSGGDKTLTLKDATITTSLNQIFNIRTGAELTLRTEGNNVIGTDFGFIMNYGTLNLIVTEPMEVGGIDNGYSNESTTLTIDAQATFTTRQINNNNVSTLTLDGEIHAGSDANSVPPLLSFNLSPGAVTFGDNARILLRANQTFCTNLSSSPFIELNFDTPPADSLPLSFSLTGNSQEPEVTFTTDGTCTNYAFLAKPDTWYTATHTSKPLYSLQLTTNSNNEQGKFALFHTDGYLHRYSTTSTIRPDDLQPLDLSTDYGYGNTLPLIDLRYDPVTQWTYEGKLFDGTVTGTTNIPATINAEGAATLTLNKAWIQSTAGTALTIGSGTVTLQPKPSDIPETTLTSNFLGTHALRVEAGATCLIPADDPHALIMLQATEAAIHPDGGGTVKGLVLLTWAEPLSNGSTLYQADVSEAAYSQPLSLNDMRSAATNYSHPFYLTNWDTKLRQEGYLSDDPGQAYLSTFPGAKDGELTSYVGLRDLPPTPIVIDKTVAFDASMLDQRLVITEKGILTVDNYIRPSVSGIELRDGGQIRIGDDVEAFDVSHFTHVFPNRDQWRATTLISSAIINLTSDAGTSCYVNTGYTDATDQAWQPKDLSQLGQGAAVLIAGEGPLTDTLRLEYYSTSLFKQAPATSPTGPLNTGVFLFKGNLEACDMEMRNIYVLSDDGSRFELRETVTLRPFESYVVANEATRAMVRSLSLRDITTGTEIAPADNSLHAWTSDGRLHLRAERAEKIAIYHVNGTLKYYIPSLSGEKSVALPSGIYLVRQGGTTIKVRL